MDWVKCFNDEGYHYDASKSDDKRVTFDRKGTHPGNMLLTLNVISSYNLNGWRFIFSDVDKPAPVKKQKQA